MRARRCRGGLVLIAVSVSATLVGTAGGDVVVSPDAGVVVAQGSSSNLAAAHRAKAQLDARALETAVVNYTITFGSLPQSLDALTRRSEIAGTSGGPFIEEVPMPPPGWSPYSYVMTPNGEFSITTAGDGITIRVPAP